MLAEARATFADAIRARVNGTAVYSARPATAAAPFIFLELEDVVITADVAEVTLRAGIVVDIARAPAAALAELDDLTDRVVGAAYQTGIPDRTRAGPDLEDVAVGDIGYPARFVSCCQPFDPCALP